MYEIKDFNDAGAMLNYLNELGGHDLVHIEHNHDTWMVMVKIVKMGRPPKKVEEKVDIVTSTPRPQYTEVQPLGFPSRDNDEA